MHGTTKDFAFTIFAADKARGAVVPVTGRVQGTVAEVSKSTISVPQWEPRQDTYTSRSRRGRSKYRG